ncbi:CpaF family protein [Methanosphaera cuniculi]|uniref:Putative conjugal transfer proteinc n=1 Tax=Methanosphaera cuniculi TaxID=1077256 RepID=A0A2V2BN78_9EURY|nr:CpaF family protein [Methanosphaera cuniculi]PWL07530.1 putative conjugal transfer proteinc [Methanosphaera cuniculi]
MKQIPQYKTQKIEKLTENEIQQYQQIKQKIIQQNITDNTQTTLKQKIQENTKNTKIIQKLISDINQYGKIDPLLNDDELEEIMIIGDNKPIYVYHRTIGMMITDITLKNTEIRQIIDKIANNTQRKIDKQTPLLDARLDDGSRINATIPPISADGPTLTIRKFKKDPLTIIDLIENKTLTYELAAFLWLVIEGCGVNPSNIIIAGGTGSGKTTTLNTLTQFIPPYERIISIEDTLEMQIPHKHIIRTETRPPNIENKGEITMDLLLKNSLRQRPDRIIVGEVRSKEAITLFSALNTGHSGMGTLHANSTHETITRLTNPPMNVPNIMINSINFIIMQKRLYNPHLGTIRRITEVAEVVGMENNKIQLNKIYQYNPQKDTIEYVAINTNTLNIIAQHKNMTKQQINEELIKRQNYLKQYTNKNHNIKKVQQYIDQYYYR